MEDSMGIEGLFKNVTLTLAFTEFVRNLSSSNCQVDTENLWVKKMSYLWVRKSVKASLSLALQNMWPSITKRVSMVVRAIW